MLRLVSVAALVVAACLGIVGSTLAVGLIVRPRVLSVVTGLGRPATTELLVSGVNQEPAIYSVDVRMPWSWFWVSPTSFRLDPDSQQLISVTVWPYWFGSHDGTIMITSRPLGASELTAVAGIKVPLTVAVKVSVWWYLVGGAMVLVGGLGLWGVLQLLRARQ